MTEHFRDRPAPEPHFYYMLPKYRKWGYMTASLLATLGVGLALSAWMLGTTVADRVTGSLVSLLTILLAALGARATRWTVLEVSAGAVAWASLGSLTVACAWRHVAGIGPMDYRGREGLKLSQPEYTWPWWALYARWYEEMGFFRTIPLWLFADDWRETQLGRDIRLYAPQLVDEIHT